MDQERDEVLEVEEARRRVAEDVQSVSQDANVVQRAKDMAQERVEGARNVVRGGVDNVRNAADSVRDAASSIAGNVNLDPRENAVGMLLAGLAVGFLIGMCLPVTRFESERIGPLTEDMKERAREAGRQAVRRGGEVIKETITAGKEAATQSIKEQARDMTAGSTTE